MFLSDTEIRKEIKRGAIRVFPILDFDSQLGSCSLDLRMGTTFMVFRRSAIPYIDPLSSQLKEAFETKPISFGGKVIIHPGMDVLTTTLEEIELSSDIVGFVSGRSSLIRLGLSLEAGRVDPGFQGKIVLRLHNFSGVPIAVSPGMRIASLAFARLSGTVQRVYAGKYQRTESFEPKMFLDKDIQLLKVVPHSDLDRLLKQRIPTTDLVQMGLQELSSKLGEAHKNIVRQIFRSGRITTPKLAAQLNYNKYYVSTVMKELRESTIVESLVVRGKGGGFFYNLTDIGKALAEFLERETPEVITSKSCDKSQVHKTSAYREDIHVIAVNIIPRSSSASNHLNDECVLLENQGNLRINLVGWKIFNLIPRGTKLYSYTFPSKLPNGNDWQLEPGQRLRLVTGKGKDHLAAQEGKKGELIFFWNREWFAWWPGDTIVLIDEEGNEVTRFKIQ